MEPLEGLNFGQALERLKTGFAVARSGWNGKGLRIGLQVPDKFSANTLPYLYIVNPVNHQLLPESRVPWVASQTDVLADDWFVLGSPEE